MILEADGLAIAFGGVHAVFVAKNGTRIGVADPRRDGVAGGY